MSISFYLPNPETYQKLVTLNTNLQNKFGENVIDYSLAHKELAITIKPESLLDVISFVRNDNNCMFRQLTEITAVDYPTKHNRFVVVYQLLSLDFNIRLRLKIEISEHFIVPSISDRFSNADWLEREVFDMFGIYFSNHPDFRRILTDFGFEGYPLRKDFPLTGYTEVYYNEVEEQVKYKPVELQREYNNFTSINPWLKINKTTGNL